MLRLSTVKDIITTKIRFSFDGENFQKKFEWGRTKAENRADRGGGCGKVGQTSIGEKARRQV